MQPALIEQYENDEAENGGVTNSNSKIVYDSLDPSPYYTTQNGDTKSSEVYMNDNDLLDLPADDGGLDGYLMNNPSGKSKA